MFDKEIKELRDSIDALDKELLKNVANRMQLVRKVGALKKKNNVEVVQADRWQQLLDSRMSWSEEMEMSREEIKQVFETLHTISVNRQKDIIKD
jgi:chorismate mutase